MHTSRSINQIKEDDEPIPSRSRRVSAHSLSSQQSVSAGQLPEVRSLSKESLAKSRSVNNLSIPVPVVLQPSTDSLFLKLPQSQQKQAKAVSQASIQSSLQLNQTSMSMHSDNELSNAPRYHQSRGSITELEKSQDFGHHLNVKHDDRGQSVSSFRRASVMAQAIVKIATGKDHHHQRQSVSSQGSRKGSIIPQPTQEGEVQKKGSIGDLFKGKSWAKSTDEQSEDSDSVEFEDEHKPVATSPVKLLEKPLNLLKGRARSKSQVIPPQPSVASPAVLEKPKAKAQMTEDEISQLKDKCYSQFKPAYDMTKLLNILKEPRTGYYGQEVDKQFPIGQLKLGFLEKPLVYSLTKIPDAEQQFKFGVPPYAKIEMLDGKPIGEYLKSGDSIQVSSNGLVIQKVPDDNSCLFHAVAYVLKRPNDNLRQIISLTVEQHPLTFTSTVLGMPPVEYQAYIQDPQVWGGAIECQIFAHHYLTEIVSIDVETGVAYRFGEDAAYSQRVFILYSGIHYDAIKGADGQTVFDVVDDAAFASATRLAAEERKSHNYTNVGTFLLKCGQCQQQFKGQREAQEHSQRTGHTQFSEVH